MESGLADPKVGAGFFGSPQGKLSHPQGMLPESQMLSQPASSTNLLEAGEWT